MSGTDRGHLFDLVDAHQTISRSPGRLPAARDASSKGRPERLAQPRERSSSRREPGALGALRHALHFDIMSAVLAGVRHLDDRQVFGRAWQLKRVLVTHDPDFLNDAVFPLQACSGLLVLPVYGAVSLEFGNLLSASASLIGRGESMWFQHELARRFDLRVKVRTWDCEGIA